MSSIFSRIVNGELPGHVLWQDELCYSILTLKPVREGHVLLIPRAEIDSWDEIPEATTAHLFITAQKISRVLRSLFPCQKIGMMIAGLEVRHAHVHLFPINALTDLDFSLARERSDEAQQITADLIRNELCAAGYSEAKLPL
jgi:histidine triad (HIT) family protein